MEENKIDNTANKKNNTGSKTNNTGKYTVIAAFITALTTISGIFISDYLERKRIPEEVEKEPKLSQTSISSKPISTTIQYLFKKTKLDNGKYEIETYKINNSTRDTIWLFLYEGDFNEKENYYSGQGKETDMRNGDYWEGTWIKGNKEGDFIIYESGNEVCYKCSFNNNLEHLASKKVINCPNK